MKKRKINWFHVGILLLPVIALVVICCILLCQNKATPAYLALPEQKEKVDIEEFTNLILAEMSEKEKEAKINSYLGTFLCTAYDDCYECQEEFVGTTALGVAPTVNHTIAVDPSIIPLGTRVLINGIEYVAEDVGGGVNSYHIDIFVGSHEETYLDNYNGYFDVYLIRE